MTDPAVPPTGDDDPPPELTPAKRAVFACVTLLLILAVVEGFFSVREVARDARRKARGSPRQPDAWTGASLTPSHRFEENGLVAVTNSLGMRAPEPTVPKPAGTTRLLFLGGSTTYGLYTAANDRAWPELVGARLRATRPGVEALNGACPAWDVRCSQTNLERRLYALEPDVVVACHVYNDLVANLDPDYAEEARVEWDGRWTGLWDPLHGHCATYRAARSKFWNPREALKTKVAQVGEAGVAGYEQNLRRLIRRSREQGARVLLCTEPSCFRPTLEQSEREGVPGLDRWFHELSPFDYPTLLAGFARYSDVLRRVAAETDTPLCDLERLMSKDVALFKSPLHHTDAGEELVAAHVAKALVDSGLVR